MNKITKENKKDFIILFIITCIIFLPFLTGHYATDTYNVANVGYNKYALNWSLTDGRIFMAAITLIAGKLKISIEAFSFITLILGLVVSVISVLYIKNIVNRYKKTKSKYEDIIVTIISYFTIFNFMYIEIMYFVESFVIAVSVLLYIIAADILVKKEKNYIIKSLLVIITATLFYQGSIGMYFITVLLISILRNKNNIKEIFLDVVKSGIIAFIGVCINMVFVKIIEKLYGTEQIRLNTINMIIPNIIRIIQNTPEVLVYTCRLFPPFVYLVFSLGIIEILAFHKDNKEKTISIILKAIAIFLMGIFSASIIYVLAFTSFNTGRMRISMGATIGMLFILVYTETTIFEKKNVYLYLLTTMVIGYSIITIIDMEYLMFSHKKVNAMEKQEVEIINNYIDEYEKETGIKVTKISKIHIPGKTEEAYYAEVKNRSTFTCKATRSALAADAVVKYLSGRNLKKVTSIEDGKIEIVKEKTKENNGYCCIGDTFYIEIYML